VNCGHATDNAFVAKQAVQSETVESSILDMSPYHLHSSSEYLSDCNISRMD
jgi:hypothetical protein